MKNRLEKQIEESGDWRPTANAASRVEDAAIEDLASMLLRAAELTGCSAEELLAGISDLALSDLYRGIVCRLPGGWGPAEADALTEAGWHRPARHA